MPEYHRKHTPIVSRQQQKLFGAKLSRREAGEPPQMPGITKKELKAYLEESRGKRLPENSTNKTMNEVYMYGGLPLRYADIVRDLDKQSGGNIKLREAYLRGGLKHPLIGVKPISLKEFQDITNKTPCLQPKVKLLKLHDDGDMTVQKGRERYVITTEGETFKATRGMGKLLKYRPHKLPAANKPNKHIKHRRRSRIIYG